MDRTLGGCSGVCIVFAPHPPYTELFCAEATESIRRGMRRIGIDRIVCLTGAMIGSFPDNRSRPWRLERAWTEAEEIAVISDSLLLPTGTGEFIEKQRSGTPPESGRDDS